MIALFYLIPMGRFSWQRFHMACQMLTDQRNGNDDEYEHAYDDNGNITSITRGSISVTYEYNGANELVRENNGFTNQTVI